jgi:hypothetical protein
MLATETAANNPVVALLPLLFVGWLVVQGVRWFIGQHRELNAAAKRQTAAQEHAAPVEAGLAEPEPEVGTDAWYWRHHRWMYAWDHEFLQDAHRPLIPTCQYLYETTDGAGMWCGKTEDQHRERPNARAEQGVA